MRDMQLVGVMAVALTTAACGAGPSPSEPPSVPPPPPPPAAETSEADTSEALIDEPEPAAMIVTAKLMAKSDSKLAGTVSLTPVDEGVKVIVNVQGVEPGKHGVHIHEKADCSAPDAKSAGGHFNPGGHDHALPAESPRHLGDLGNIEVGQNGMGNLEVVREGASLEPDGDHSFVGRALIVHANEDDGGQPTGNAGGRIGCAEIRALTP